MVDDLKQKSVLNCYFVKTVLMLLVVLYHSILFWNGTWFQIYEPNVTIPIVSILTKWLNSFHIQCFTLISGYVYGYLRFEKGKYGDYLPFVLSKLKRLIIPYYFVCLFWAIPIEKMFYHDNSIVIIKKYILGSSPAQLWFLLMLFFIFVTVYWMSEQIHENLKNAVFVSAIFYGIGIIGSHYCDNYFMIWQGCQFMVFFVLGMKLRQYQCEGKIPVYCGKSDIVILCILDLVLFLLNHFMPKSGFVYKIISIFSSLALSVVGSIMAFFFFQGIAKKTNWMQSVIFQ